VVSDEPRGGTGPSYSLAKAESSRYVLNYLDNGGSGVDFAVHNTYGPGQPQGRFVAKLISRAVERREIEILNPLQVHDFVHVDDVARGILAGALSRVTPANSIELGTGLGASVKELANDVYDLAEAPRSLIKETSGVTPGEAEIAKTQGALDLLGWRAEISLRDGLKQMIELAKA
jgi:dTDP-L-rhamnose 4-epimerase